MIAPVVGAVDSGGTKTLVAVVPSPVGPWRPHGSLRFPTPRDPDEFVDRVATALERLARAAGAQLVAVGCASPGPLDATRSVVIDSPNQGWRHVPVRDLLATRLRVPVVLEDDGNAAALGEARLPDRDPTQTLVFVALGTGIGSGVVVSGAIHRGAHSAAGELGHLVVQPGGRLCACGRRGCVEAYAGGRSLADRFSAVHGRPVTGAAEVFAAARHGDPAATALVEDATEALAVGLAALIMALDPSTVVFGGSLGLRQRRFALRAARRACELAWTANGYPSLEHGRLGGQAALAGAAWLAAEAA